MIGFVSLFDSTVCAVGKGAFRIGNHLPADDFVMALDREASGEPAMVTTTADGISLGKLVFVILELGLSFGPSWN